ncbi:MAG: response regulator transcription factor [Planctomycetales bacterium]|nr:response regulator transcription factor [Planctomycetales bacterium]
MLLLVVDDDPDMLGLLAYNLGRAGMSVLTASDGEKALALARTRKPDLVLLDLMLPGMDGIAVCRALRKASETSGTPIIMLTARADENDVVEGLEAGADDYVTKPFSPREVIARVKTVLRRAGAAARSPSGRLVREDVEIDPERHQTTVRGKPLDLTATEFRLLYVLASRPGRVFTRNQLLAEARGPGAAAEDRTVDVHVASLRRKLGARGEAIETVRGVGYRFREE